MYATTERLLETQTDLGRFFFPGFINRVIIDASLILFCHVLTFYAILRRLQKSTKHLNSNLSICIHICVWQYALELLNWKWVVLG